MASQQQEQQQYDYTPQNQYSQQQMVTQSQPMFVQQPMMTTAALPGGGCRGNAQCVAICDIVLSSIELILAIVFVGIMGAYVFTDDTPNGMLATVPLSILTMIVVVLIIAFALLITQLVLAVRLLSATKIGMSPMEAAGRAKCWLIFSIINLILELCSLCGSGFSLLRCSFVCVIYQYFHELQMVGVVASMGAMGMMNTVPTASNYQFQQQQQLQQQYQEDPNQQKSNPFSTQDKTDRRKLEKEAK